MLSELLKRPLRIKLRDERRQWHFWKFRWTSGKDITHDGRNPYAYTDHAPVREVVLSNYKVRSLDNLVGTLIHETVHITMGSSFPEADVVRIEENVMRTLRQYVEFKEKCDKS